MPYSCGVCAPVSYTHLDVYKRQGQQRAARFRASTLGDGYGPEDVQAVIDGKAPTRTAPAWRTPAPRRVNLLIDIQERMRQGKGPADVYKRQLNSRVVCFVLKGMGENLRKIAMHITNDFVTSAVGTNFKNGVATWCYFDEFHILLRDPLTASYFVTVWKMLRKQGCVPSAQMCIRDRCKAIYDKNAETILGNMDSVLFLGGRESSTIKEISENWLGKATISMQTEGRSRGQSESYSQNTQRLGRELMTPSELATMPGDRCVLQLRGLPPFYSRKYDLKQHPNYRFTAEADKVKNAFDLDRLIDRRRRPGMNEECEVHEVSLPDEALTDEDEDILNYDDLDDPDAFV